MKAPENVMQFKVNNLSNEREMVGVGVVQKFTNLIRKYYRYVVCNVISFSLN